MDARLSFGYLYSCVPTTPPRPRCKLRVGADAASSSPVRSGAGGAVFVCRLPIGSSDCSQQSGLLVKVGYLNFGYSFGLRRRGFTVLLSGVGYTFDRGSSMAEKPDWALRAKRSAIRRKSSSAASCCIFSGWRWLINASRCARGAVRLLRKKSSNALINCAMLPAGGWATFRFLSVGHTSAGAAGPAEAEPA